VLDEAAWMCGSTRERFWAWSSIPLGTSMDFYDLTL
jgi:hypothetical protein